MQGIVVLFIIVVIAIIVLATYFSRDRRIKRAIRALPHSDIGNATAGLTKVSGQLIYAQPPLQAPLSGRACAFFEVKVDEYRQHGKSGSWRTIIRETLGQPFLLQDASGRALVQLEPSAEVVANRDLQDKSGMFNDASPVLEAFLSRHGVSSTGLFGFNKKLRVYEGLLEAGEIVTVVGSAAREVDPNPQAGFAGYRDQPTWLVIRRSQERPMMVSDDPSLARGGS